MSSLAIAAIALFLRPGVPPESPLALSKAQQRRAACSRRLDYEGAVPPFTTMYQVRH